MINVITRKAAKTKGLKYYFTGKECKLGHTSVRYSSNGICVDCQSVSNKKHWSNNGELLRIQHKERLKEKGEKYNTNRREKYHTDKLYQVRVKTQTKKWYDKNKEIILNDIQRKEQMKLYRNDNSESISKNQKEWRNQNKAHVNKRASIYRKHNRGYYNAQWAKYRSAKIQATPLWYEKADIEELYNQSQILTETTGIQYEVDHIIPLQGKKVCGLHCFANLQILTRTSNRIKSNKLTI